MICHHRHLKLSVRDGIRTELILQSVYNMLDAVGAKPKDDPCARAGGHQTKNCLILFLFLQIRDYFSPSPPLFR